MIAFLSSLRRRRAHPPQPTRGAAGPTPGIPLDPSKGSWPPGRPAKSHPCAGSLALLLGLCALAPWARLDAQGISVLQPTTPVEVTAGSAAALQFTVQSYAGGTAGVELTTTCAGAVSGCTIKNPSSTILGFYLQTFTVNFVAGGSGSGTVTFTARFTSGTLASSTQAVTVSIRPTTTPDSMVVITASDAIAGDRWIVSSQPVRVQYVVRNPSLAMFRYAVEPICSGVVSGCQVLEGTPIELMSQATRVVTIAGTAGPARDALGTMTLRVTPNVPGAPAAMQSALVRTLPAPAVATTSPKPIVEVVAGPGTGPTNEKAGCLHFRLVSDVASTCGALEVVHPLPAVRTFGQVRRPTLLYSSDAADPVLNIAVNLRPPNPGTLDSVRTELLVRSGTGSYAPLARRTDRGAPWRVLGDTGRRVGLVAVPPFSLAPTLVPYRVQVTFYRGTTAEPQPAVDREAAIVHRLASPFGAGWWLATLEQVLPLADGTKRLLWVDGDGGTRVYRPVSVLPTGDSVFVAPALTAADTLLRLATRPAGDSLAGTQYVRRLGHPRARVEFDGTGTQRRVVTPLGHVTQYGYGWVPGPSPNESRWVLRTITVAPASAGLTYQFEYTAGFLSAVLAPGGRRTVLAPEPALGLSAAARVVRSIQDPDTTRVWFTQRPTTPARIETRTDRRGTVTTFGYEGSTRSLALASTPANATDTVRHAFRVGHALGANAATPLPLDATTSRYDGPRTDVSDVTAITTDTLGQPVVIVNALGDTIRVERADARWPGLVTRSVTPTGALGTRDTLVSTAVYDARARLIASTVENPFGDGRTATTTYGWDDRWNTVARVTSPEGLSQYTGYDGYTGYRLWTQVGPDPARRVMFSYYLSSLAAGMVRSTTIPGGRPETYEYDDALGNLQLVTTPLGLTTTVLRDALGRDTLTVGPGGVRSRSRYDVMDQVVEQWTAAHGSVNVGGTTLALAESVYVATEYDQEGSTKRATRRMHPDPNSIGDQTDTWDRDGLGRVTYHGGAARQRQHRYDPAGNVVWTDRGDSTVYDAVGRRTKRLLPRVAAAPFLQTVLRNTRLQDAATGGAPADTERFAYDRAGNLTEADNQYAVIRRRYYRGGALRRDSSALLFVGASDTAARRMERSYDLDGRVTELRHNALSAVVVQRKPHFRVARA